MVRQVLHEHAASLLAAGHANRSRRLIKCAKDSGHYPRASRAPPAKWIGKSRDGPMPRRKSRSTAPRSCNKSCLGKRDQFEEFWPGRIVSCGRIPLNTIETTISITCENAITTIALAAPPSARPDLLRVYRPRTTATMGVGAAGRVEGGRLVPRVRYADPRQHAWLARPRQGKTSGGIGRPSAGVLCPHQAIGVCDDLPRRSICINQA